MRLAISLAAAATALLANGANPDRYKADKGFYASAALYAKHRSKRVSRKSI